jgi:TROVE domain.
MLFNEQKETVEERTESTNHEGGQSFDPDSAELALAKVVINNLLDDTYYESAEEQFATVESAFDECADENPEFVLKLAKYARQEENLRQIPQALFVLAVENEQTRPFVEDYACGIMSRTDEPLDVLALYVSRNGKTLPGVLQRSIENAMHQWNEWQYAKWDQPNKQWQYRDLLNLVHPAPRDDQRDAIFEKIAHGDLDDYDV